MTAILAQGPLFLVCLAFLLGAVVVIHELGHYYAGRFFGAAVESFSVGFGSSIAERTDKRGTRWRVNWIPLGGFVKFVGESQTAGDVGKVEEGPLGKPYHEIGPWGRIVVSLAGPFANFVLAVVLFAIFFGFRGVNEYDVYAARVSADQPAAIAGMQEGDVIKTIDGTVIRKVEDLIQITVVSSGLPLAFGIERDGQPKTLIITPERQVRPNAVGQIVPQGTIGVAPWAVEGTVVRRTFGPITASIEGVAQTGKTLQTTGFMLKRIVTGNEPISSLSGPVAVGDAGRRVVNQIMGAEGLTLGQKLSNMFWTALQLCAAVSVGIGFFNLLPLPVLDGGHVVFNLYEIVTGKIMPEKVQEMALMTGMALLLTMFVFITWGDILETGLFNRAAG